MPDTFLDTEQQTALALRIQSGDHGAEDELVRCFSSRVFALLLARLRDREAAKDLLQETLLAVITAVRGGRLHDTSVLAAFILATARNQAAGYIRGLAQRPAHIPYPVEGFAFAEADPIESGERDALTRSALLQLDSTDRAILTRTLIEGEKPGVIARFLGLSSEVVRQRKTRAIKKVAEYVRRASQSAGSDDISSGRKLT